MGIKKTLYGTADDFFKGMRLGFSPTNKEKGVYKVGKILVKDKRGYSYYRKDTGKKGRTPESRRWSKGIEVPETGWSKDVSPKERRELVLEANNGDYLKAARYMQYLVNLSSDPETDRKAKSDAEYFFRKHKLEG